MTTSAWLATAIASLNPALLSPSISHPLAYNKLVPGPTLFCNPSHCETIKFESTVGIDTSQKPLFCNNDFTNGPTNAIFFKFFDRGKILLLFLSSTILFAAIDLAAATCAGLFNAAASRSLFENL